MTDEQLYAFILRYAVPWYFSFYASWINSDLPTAFVSYEALVEDLITLQEICMNLGTKISLENARAMKKAKGSKTRLNKGIIGRGDSLRYMYSKDMAELASMYPSVDFSKILK